MNKHKPPQHPHLPTLQTPDQDYKRLQRVAAQGLPVKGMRPTWEANRPTVLPTRNADKVGAGGAEG